MEPRVDKKVASSPPPENLTSADPVRSLARSKYSDRVLLLSILERADRGAGLAGEKVVVGGWVKSSREEVKKEPAPATQLAPEGKPPAEVKDTSCVEMFQTRVPIIRTIVKVFCGGSHSDKQKAEAGVANKQVTTPPPPSVAVLQVSDGSCIPSLQIMVDSSLATPSHLLPTGTSVLVEGLLRQPLTRGKHAIELQAEKVLHIGTIDHDSYVLTKKRLPLDSLRSALQFRSRTTTVACVMRIRNVACFATHTFFHDHGFLEVHLPIITTTDAEGSNQKFRVTLLPKRADEKRGSDAAKDDAVITLDLVRASVNEKTKKVEELKRSDSNKEALITALEDLKKVNELALQLERKEKKQKFGDTVKAEEVKLSQEFFPNETYLTVSGHLHLQSYASAMGQVYSFGPRFRADRTESPKKLAEMWTVEVEMAFSALEDAMKCAEDYLKFLCKWVLDSCPEDMKFIAKRVDKTCVERLRSAMSKPWEKIPYSKALDDLKKAKEKMETKVEPHAALTAEDFSNLADEIYKGPVIVYNPPKKSKPFYTRVNEDGETVAAFDLVLPKVGKIITGTQNEERMDKLDERIKEMRLAREQYEWHLDLLKQGTVKSSGFSFSFDLMILFATGLTDIRDVVPFPRSSTKVHC